MNINETGFFHEAFRLAFDPLFAAEERANDILTDANVDNELAREDAA